VSLPVEGQSAGRTELRHEHHQPMFFRIDEEHGIEKSFPGIRGGRADFLKGLDSFEARTQPESRDSPTQIPAWPPAEPQTNARARKATKPGRTRIGFRFGPAGTAQRFFPRMG
jgi:hypothetical protein